MTQNEKLDLIIEKITGIDQDVNGLKQDVAELRQDMTGLKQDVSELRQDVTVLQQDVSDIKVDLQCLHADDHMILDEIVRVHGFETVYITVYCRKLVCTRFPFSALRDLVLPMLYDSFFQNTTFVSMNSIAAFRQYYSIFPFIFSSFMMASLEPNTIFC